MLFLTQPIQQLLLEIADPSVNLSASECFPGQYRFKVDEVIFHLTTQHETASHEVFPLQHISAPRNPSESKDSAIGRDH